MPSNPVFIITTNHDYEIRPVTAGRATDVEVTFIVMRWKFKYLNQLSCFLIEDVDYVGVNSFELSCNIVPTYQMFISMNRLPAALRVIISVFLFVIIQSFKLFG